MRLLHSMPPHNFAGLEEKFSNFESASAVVLPVPFDSTASWKSGAREGPEAIIEASRFMELYNPQLNFEAFRKGICTLEELEPVRANAEATIERVREVAEEILEKKKFPVLLGGDHAIMLGGIRAVNKKFDNFDVVVLDAHLDCWDEFEGSKFSHAATTREAQEETGKNVLILGARAMSLPEKEIADKNEKINYFSVEQIRKNTDEILEEINKLGRNIYLSIDLDVLDPSEMPALSNPVPAGMHYEEMKEIIKFIAQNKKIIGADITELCPIPGFNAPNALAAQIVYDLITFKYFWGK